MTGWQPTHYSINDGSTVRLINDMGDYYTVENENGNQFNTSSEHWYTIEPIPVEETIAGLQAIAAATR